MILQKIIFFLFLTLTFQCEYDSRLNNYKDYAEAINQKKSDRAWLPKILLLSANSISEKHDLDTNRVWVSYYAENNELRNLVKKETSDPDLKNSFIQNVDNFAKAASFNEKLFYFKFTDGIYAIDLNNNIVYFISNCL
ncbi:hypothetical protein EHQ76_07560 [Leptospira barantonii]|uniref:YbbD head domain-containing protein n=1 Tax=Leptospira barantonii TaxID=2023184 RepID=A0A5F2BGH9_9LEPT|nr:hypothetical protein [Leptospira barantonii]TGM04686.1 hypothetical protein EHQ76_07560 [Leptospira barantonii]